MAEKSVLAILVTLAVILALGVGYNVHQPEVKTVNQFVDRPVEKIVYQNVTVPVEVDTVLADHQTKAVNEFLAQYKDDEAYPTGFADDQLTKTTVSKDFTIEATKKTETVSFDVSFKFVDKDTNKRNNVVTQDCNGTVEFDLTSNPEDPVVDYVCN